MTDNTVLVIGGWNTSGNSNEVWKSLDGGSTWSLVTNNAWSLGMLFLMAALSIPLTLILLTDESLNELLRVSHLSLDEPDFLASALHHRSSKKSLFGDY